MANDNLTPEDIRAMLRITCADAGSLLSDYHDGALPAADHARVEAHIGGCVACGVILDQIHTTTMVLRAASARRAAPDVEIVDEILGRLREPPE